MLVCGHRKEHWLELLDGRDIDINENEQQKHKIVTIRVSNL